MASQYTYDEEGEVWPYFLLAVLTFVLIPLSIKYAYRVFSNDHPLQQNGQIPGAVVENHSTLAVPNADAIKAYQRRKTSSRIVNKTLVVLLVGWAAVFFIAAKYAQDADMSTVFDPYEILGIASSATEKQIKSHYRKLSLKFHPDKMPRDLTEKAKQEMEALFIRINKAYNALTDEATRENFLKYGHPDGQQDVSHGIALPTFLVEGKYSSILIVFYFLLIGALLPYIVGSWWSNVKSHTAKGLHVDTAGLFVRKLTDRNPSKIITPYDLLDLLCLSQEIRSGFPHLQLNEVKQLISKHLTRDFSLTPAQEADKLKIVSKLPALIDGFVDIAAVFKNHDVVVAALDLKKSVIQAVPPVGKHQELLQLPYVDSKVVVAQPVKKLGKLLTLSREEAGKVLGITDLAKVDKALDVARHICSLRVVESEFRVPGEEVVPPKSKAHLSVRYLVKSPKLKSCPEIKEDRLKIEETIEYMKDPTKVNNEAPLLPFTYSPYFPEDFRNSWSGVIVAQATNKLAPETSVIKVTNIDLSNVDLTQEEWIKGDKVKIGTLNVQLPEATPVNEGLVHYRLILKNDAYFGCDVDIPLVLETKIPPVTKADTEKLMKVVKDGDESDTDESDISDPEEDSLAGALAALRGAPVKKTEEAKVEEIDEDEEDVDDNESVFSDINTDTEDEDGGK